MTYAMQVAGRDVLTIEGLQDEAGLAPIQRAFVEKGGLQCGFCTPGFVMSAYALLLSKSNPSEGEIKDALAGNICRCTGYVKIIESVKAAAELRREDSRWTRAIEHRSSTALSKIERVTDSAKLGAP
jgi:carbon-monoxide dehydrogenase small subunit